MIPQIIIICLLCMSFTIAAVKHGESKGEYNVWHSIIAIIINVIILYYGGFFDCFIKN